MYCRRAYLQICCKFFPSLCHDIRANFADDDAGHGSLRGKTVQGTLGKSIRNARKTRQLTQAELAKAVRYHNSQVSRWESGEQLPDEDTLEALARVLGEDIVRWRVMLQEERRYMFMLQEKARHPVPDSTSVSAHREPHTPLSPPESPFYFDAAYGGLVWARVRATHKKFMPVTLVLRWGPWKMEYTTTLGHGQGVYLLFYKRSDEHPVPLFFEIEQHAEIAFGTGIPPADLPVQDINHLWSRISPYKIRSRIRYFFQSAYFALRELIQRSYTRP